MLTWCRTFSPAAFGFLNLRLLETPKLAVNGPESAMKVSSFNVMCYP